MRATKRAKKREYRHTSAADGGRKPPTVLRACVPREHAGAGARPVALDVKVTFSPDTSLTLDEMVIEAAARFGKLLSTLQLPPLTAEMGEHPLSHYSTRPHNKYDKTVELGYWVTQDVVSAVMAALDPDDQLLPLGDQQKHQLRALVLINGRRPVAARLYNVPGSWLDDHQRAKLGLSHFAGLTVQQVAGVESMIPGVPMTALDVVMECARKIPQQLHVEVEGEPTLTRIIQVKLKNKSGPHRAAATGFAAAASGHGAPAGVDRAVGAAMMANTARQAAGAAVNAVPAAEKAAEDAAKTASDARAAAAAAAAVAEAAAAEAHAAEEMRNAHAVAAEKLAEDNRTQATLVRGMEQRLMPLEAAARTAKGLKAKMKAQDTLSTARRAYDAAQRKAVDILLEMELAIKEADAASQRASRKATAATAARKTAAATRGDAEKAASAADMAAANAERAKRQAAKLTAIADAAAQRTAASQHTATQGGNNGDAEGDQVRPTQQQQQQAAMPATTAGDTQLPAATGAVQQQPTQVVAAADVAPATPPAPAEPPAAVAAGMEVDMTAAAPEPATPTAVGADPNQAPLQPTPQSGERPQPGTTTSLRERILLETAHTARPVAQAAPHTRGHAGAQQPTQGTADQPAPNRAPVNPPVDAGLDAPAADASVTAASAPATAAPTAAMAMAPNALATAPATTPIIPPASVRAPAALVAAHPQVDSSAAGNPDTSAPADPAARTQGDAAAAPGGGPTRKSSRLAGARAAMPTAVYDYCNTPSAADESSKRPRVPGPSPTGSPAHKKTLARSPASSQPNGDDGQWQQARSGRDRHKARGDPASTSTPTSNAYAALDPMKGRMGPDDDDGEEDIVMSP